MFSGELTSLKDKHTGASTLNEGQRGTKELQWRDGKGSLAFSSVRWATGRHRTGYTLLWATTASKKAVVCENAAAFLISIIITLVASSEITAWVGPMLFTPRRQVDGETSPVGDSSQVVTYNTTSTFPSLFGAPGDRCGHVTFT